MIEIESPNPAIQQKQFIVEDMMQYFTPVIEALIIAGFSFKMLRSRRIKVMPRGHFSTVDRTVELHRRQSLYGYNEHSSVSILTRTTVWFDEQTDSALNYTERGKVWLVAGETLATDINLLSATKRFLDFAKTQKKIVAFLPTTERFARLIAASTDFNIIKIGAAPYFDLQNWNPRGNKSKHLRAGLSQARRNSVTFSEVSKIEKLLRTEMSDLCEKWLKSRRSIIEFGWLFKLKPFQNEDNKRFFIAADKDGKLVGFLIASPIPARDGWYLEDVLRDSDAPNGTTELLVSETMKLLAAEGIKMATLGTAPLALDGDDELSSNKTCFPGKMLNFSRKCLNSVYNFKGIRNFKSRFVPSWWESEYILLPKGIFATLLILEAFIYTILKGD